MGTYQCVEGNSDRVKGGGYQSSALWSRTKLCELQSVHSCEIIFRSGQNAAKGDLKGLGRAGGEFLGKGNATEPNQKERRRGGGDFLSGK